MVPNGNLTLTGTGSSRNLKINPVGVGNANITVTVSDGASSANYAIAFRETSERSDKYFCLMHRCVTPNRRVSAKKKWNLPQN
ncbi:hypothetical protein [Nostoc commune]|uniref:hypothetical protein n=1 Tax=Nostoc commune TaxID=1178 RepID=UPI0018C56823|nr:hypothetical protein [Nostoc commune]MBG1261606.1 hypothetical protein [Nostoc commune BAE]